MKRFFLCGLLVVLLPAVAVAQVVVRVAPPPIVVERPALPPSPRYAWISGYQRWDGVRYVWVPGHYVIPPRPTVVWVPGHWVQRGPGWVFVGGYWR